MKKRETRLSRDRDRHRVQRARESSARVTNSWINKENSAMNYDPSISYKDDRIVSLGTMSVVCEHCLALKFKDESKGMCCLQVLILLFSGFLSKIKCTGENLMVFSIFSRVKPRRVTASNFIN